MSRALRPWTPTGDFSPQLHAQSRSAFISRNIIFLNSRSAANIRLMQLINFGDSRYFSLVVEFSNAPSRDDAIARIGTRGNYNYEADSPLWRRFDFTGSTNDFIASLTHLAHIENDVSVITNLLIWHVKNLRNENIHTNTANVETNPEVYFLVFAMRFQTIILNELSLLMTHLIQNTSNHRRLITAPPNNERRLIVRSTENRLVLHQSNVSHHLGFALFSALNLIRSIISATGMGRMAFAGDSLPDSDLGLRGLSDRDFSPQLFSDLIRMQLITSMMQMHEDLFHVQSLHQQLSQFRQRFTRMVFEENNLHMGGIAHYRPMPLRFGDQPNIGALTTVGTFSFPERPIPLPQTGNNAKTLSEIPGFDTSSIPDEFRCHLSGDVMDDPVIDPTTLNAAATTWVSAAESEKETLDQGNYNEVPRFERTWLERAIAEKDGDSPMTRQPIVTLLISDSAMKVRIEDFVQSQTSTVVPSTY